MENIVASFPSRQFNCNMRLCFERAQSNKTHHAAPRELAQLVYLLTEDVISSAALFNNFHCTLCELGGNKTFN